MGANLHPQFAVRLDDEDRELLAEVAKTEKLSRSEILRRGLRQYARELKVSTRQTRPRRKKR